MSVVRGQRDRRGARERRNRIGGCVFSIEPGLMVIESLQWPCPPVDSYELVKTGGREELGGQVIEKRSGQASRHRVWLVATALISMGGRGHLYGVWKLLTEKLSSCKGLDRSQVAQALKRLEKEGLVCSMGHEEGDTGRQREVFELTDKGRRACRQRAKELTDNEAGGKRIPVGGLDRLADAVWMVGAILGKTAQRDFLLGRLQGLRGVLGAGKQQVESTAADRADLSKLDARLRFKLAEAERDVLEEFLGADPDDDDRFAGVG